MKQTSVGNYKTGPNKGNYLTPMYGQLSYSTDIHDASSVYATESMGLTYQAPRLVNPDLPCNPALLKSCLSGTCLKTKQGT